MVKVYTRFDLPVVEGFSSENPSMTHQSFAADADINNIVSRFRETGFLVDPSVTCVRKPQFGDFTSSLDFHSAQNFVSQISNYFSQLPSNVRSFFGNDPACYFDYVNNPENRDEAVRMGLISPSSEAPVEAPAQASDPVVEEVINSSEPN